MTNKPTRDQVVEKLTEILTNDFEIDADLIKPEADLFKDMDFDSIDAVDLAVKLQQYSGKKIAPQEFKGIRTFDDVVNAIMQLLA